MSESGTHNKHTSAQADGQPLPGKTPVNSTPAEQQTTFTETQQQVHDIIARKEARRIRAKRKAHRSVWFGLGMFGLIGWSITIPTLIGTAIGMWIDAKWNGRYSWTLMLLLTGLVMGCLNAWRWVKNESEIRDD
jgi:ATP synthase protein I